MSKQAHGRGPLLTLSPELGDCFEQLLLTWPRRQFTSPIPYPGNVPWNRFCWTYEKRYGDGRLGERRALLWTTLAAACPINRRVDFPAVAGALGRAKLAAILDLGGRIATSALRNLAREKGQVAKMVEAAGRRALKLHEVIDGVGPHTPTYETDRQRHLELYNAMCKAPQTDPLLRYAIESVPRRARRGKPEQPWLRQAYRDLRDAGVPQTLRKDLLRAIGLLPLINDSPNEK
jgi:hypothetical protein